MLGFDTTSLNPLRASFGWEVFVDGNGSRMRRGVGATTASDPPMASSNRLMGASSPMPQVHGGFVDPQQVVSPVAPPSLVVALIGPYPLIAQVMAEERLLLGRTAWAMAGSIWTTGLTLHRRGVVNVWRRITGSTTAICNCGWSKQRPDCLTT